MEGMEYLYELFEVLPRCGPGVQTIELAKISNGKIIALDNHQAFLDKLMKTARDEGLEDHIVPKNMSMLEMDFDENTFDIIWSEGALYFMGFQNGLRRCHQLLKSNGCLAVTEIVFLSPNPPAPVIQYFEKEYPDIKDVKDKIELIQNEGFHLISNFTLPESSWLDSYYLSMEEELSRLNKKYQGNEIALGIFEEMKNEINLYKKYSDFYGYDFFIMQRVN